MRQAGIVRDSAPPTLRAGDLASCALELYFPRMASLAVLPALLVQPPLGVITLHDVDWHRSGLLTMEMWGMF